MGRCPQGQQHIAVTKYVSPPEGTTRNPKTQSHEGGPARVCQWQAIHPTPPPHMSLVAQNMLPPLLPTKTSPQLCKAPPPSLPSQRPPQYSH